MRIALSIALITALAASGCGGNEEITTGPSTAQSTTTTETTEPDAGDEKEETFSIERADPGESVNEFLAGDPEAALDLFFLSGDPEIACGRVATEELLRNAYGDEKGCRQAQVPGATPDDIKVEQLKVAGDRAEALVIPDGGPNDGIETRVVLVRDGGSWRVDSLEADIPAGP